VGLGGELRPPEVAHELGRAPDEEVPLDTRREIAAVGVPPRKGVAPMVKVSRLSLRQCPAAVNARIRASARPVSMVTAA
jgi:hypothetical protein